MEIKMNEEITKNAKRTRASKIVLPVAEINGIEYVVASELEQYQLTEKRKQLNCLPPLDIYRKVEAYCADTKITKATFLLDAVKDYLIKLDESYGE